MQENVVVMKDAIIECTYLTNCLKIDLRECRKDHREEMEFQLTPTDQLHNCVTSLQTKIDIASKMLQEKVVLSNSVL